MFKNPLAQYEKSHHTPGEEFVDGQVVNDHGERLVPYYSEWYTEEGREKERQRAGEYLDARKAERQARYEKADKEYKAQDASYRDLQSRRNGYSSGDSDTYKWGTVKDESAPGGGVLAVLLIVLIGGGAIAAAIASLVP